MSEQLRPSVRAEQGGFTGDLPKRYLCAAGALGCGRSLTKESYRFPVGGQSPERLSTLCRECEQSVAANFGVDKLDAGAVTTAIVNLPWYAARFNFLQPLTQREQVRCLLLAVGVDVRVTLEQEREFAAALRDRFLFLRDRHTTLDLREVT